MTCTEITSKSEGKPPSSGLKRQLGLVSATSYVTGSIIGVGIFISPAAILEGAGSSMGVALLVWVMSAAASFCGAMCYAEYGTRVHKSGGTYTYIREAYGDLAGFVYMWTNLLVLRPLGVALSSLTAAEYIIRPLYLSCPHLAPVSAKILLAFTILGLFVMCNFYSVKWSARIQTVSTVCKLVALVVVIVAGIVHLCQGHVENLKDPFVTTDLTPGKLGTAIIAGFFAYMGWENINTAAEEIMNPNRTIPMAILGGLAIPTLTYVLANVAYHAVLTDQEILSGVAVAVVFGERKLGYFKWMMLPCVAISAGGIANCVIFGSSRLNYVAGRDGLMPRFLGMVNSEKNTPQPSILLLFFLGTVMLMMGDVLTIVAVFSLFSALGEALAIAGMVIIRRKHPATSKTFVAHWIFPITYVLIFACIAVSAVAENPDKYLFIFLMTLFGVPVYYVTRSQWWHHWRLKHKEDWITLLCHRLLLCQHTLQPRE